MKRSPQPNEVFWASHPWLLGSLPSPYPWVRRPSPWQRYGPAVIAAGLFLLTVLSTLAVGAQFAQAYAAGRPIYSVDLDPYLPVLQHPRLLLAGLPFSFTLMGILLAHELGHFFACRYYGIPASYPYFIPAPTLIGTLGAFIRIRAPIINRQALFDVGLAGPVVGFLFALPALMIGIATSKALPGPPPAALITFGNPLLVQLLAHWLRPETPLSELLLNPIARAAWVGLLATALNLLPAGQLDGGHIVYALAPERHRALSLGVILALIPLSYRWPGWMMWALLLLVIGFRHPPLLDRHQPLNPSRRIWAWIGLGIFLLCFTPVPFTIRQ